ncbi:sugar ABC transporter permease [Tessaracoccus sp. MC1865]|uniref:carbohydrate ABC transporter permease n=1 Tax=unclassified Tessaracoccus TaxID=2635419 RepID=UPI0016038FE5|nr:MULTISPECIES: sugar ABC transporter permease [unclassified Tessaracoccus]MBB1484412.1 sugar ABC transporter permease [Tessaracoccus sp. MC1865]MBB1509276.1 sugar ABC transporter permease [Tessaracoccus sp. MC1756]QTO38482.1 sugar ABC transporter permease [Tessaracoccus sp. MC1865]
MSSPSTTAEPKRRRWSRQARHQAISGWAFALPFFLAFCLVFIAPIVSSARSALFTMKASGGLYGGGTMTEQFVGLENFRVAASNPAFWEGVGRVMLFGLVQIPVMIGVALLLALLLDSYLVRRPGFWRLSYFLPYAIPGLIAAIVWGYLYIPEVSPFADAFGSVQGSPFFLSPPVVLWSMANMTTWTYTGYNMLIFLAALQAIPGDLYEAARIDGASGWKITTQIKIPMVGSAALLAVLLSIIGTVQLFNEPAVVQTLATWMPNSYTPMMMAYNTMMGQITPSGAGMASAISILMALIAGSLAIVYFLAQRRLQK